MAQTQPRFDVPMAMLVALPRESEQLCRTVLEHAAFQVAQFENESAAIERIAVVMPHVVVLPVGVAALDEISERTRAVGAELVELPPNLDQEAVRRILRSAWEKAFRRPR